MTSPASISMLATSLTPFVPYKYKYILYKLIDIKREFNIPKSNAVSPSLFFRFTFAPELIKSLTTSILFIALAFLHIKLLNKDNF